VERLEAGRVWEDRVRSQHSTPSPASPPAYYAIKDHQNTVIALADSSGTVVESYEYDAYGNTQVFDAIGTELTASALENRYTFQGREIDWHTGLHYFRARWYDPETGRWLSKDPIGISGGLNLYVAFANNPVNFIDPSGLLSGKNKGKASDAIRAEGAKNGIEIPKDVADALADEMGFREGLKLRSSKTSKSDKEKIMEKITERVKGDKKVPESIKEKLDELAKKAKEI